MESKDLIPIVISVLSLVVSLYVAYLQYRQQQEQLTVSSSFGVVNYSNGDISNQQLILTAANTGERSITVSSVRLMLPDKRTLILPEAASTLQIPCELTLSKAVTVFWPLYELGSALIRSGFRKSVVVTPEFVTQTNKVFKGKSLTIEPRKLV